MVMALKRSIARVSFDPQHRFRDTLRIRQDSAACVSLPSNPLVKEQLSDTDPLASPNRLALKTTRLLPDDPGREPRGVVRQKPLTGNEAAYAPSSRQR